MAVRFGIIFITDGFITDDKTKELRSILERKKECNFIWFNESRAIIHESFFVSKILLLLWYLQTNQTNQIQYSI